MNGYMMSGFTALISVLVVNAQAGRHPGRKLSSMISDLPPAMEDFFPLSGISGSAWTGFSCLVRAVNNSLPCIGSSWRQKSPARRYPPPDDLCSHISQDLCVCIRPKISMHPARLIPKTHFLPCNPPFSSLYAAHHLHNGFYIHEKQAYHTPATPTPMAIP